MYLYGEPVPQYIVFQAFANEGAKVVAQLTHQLDAVDLSAEGLSAALAQGDTVPHLPAQLPLGGERQSSHDRHHL